MTGRAAAGAGRRIYLDHNATSPLCAEARAAMAGAFEAGFGNPSSAHGAGRAARDAVETARREVAALIAADPAGLVFTSGGTESDATAILGLARDARRAGRGAHVVSSPLEHPAVSGALGELASEGFVVSLVPPGAAGGIDPEAVVAAFRPDTALVTLALANHEIGTLTDVAAVAGAGRERGILVHTDAVQAVGRIPVDVAALGIDALSLSAHKLGGPAGVGALWLRHGVAPAPLLAGGHQERGRRAGTENLLGIMGFGAASRAAAAALAAGAGASLTALRDRLEEALLAIRGARVHGRGAARVPGTSNLGFAGVPGQLLMAALDLEGVCVSTGAACTSGSVRPSPVLLALGLTPAQAAEGVRLSLGPGTTARDADEVAGLVPRLVDRVRSSV